MYTHDYCSRPRRCVLLQAQQMMREVHGLQEEKLLLSQIKGKSSLQKAYSKSVRQASRRSNTMPSESPNLHDILTPEQLRKVGALRPSSSSTLRQCSKRCWVRIKPSYGPIFLSVVDVPEVNFEQAHRHSVLPGLLHPSPPPLN